MFSIIARAGRPCASSSARGHRPTPTSTTYPSRTREPRRSVDMVVGRSGGTTLGGRVRDTKLDSLYLALASVSLWSCAQQDALNPWVLDSLSTPGTVGVAGYVAYLRPAYMFSSRTYRDTIGPNQSLYIECMKGDLTVSFRFDATLDLASTLQDVRSDGVQIPMLQLKARRGSYTYMAPVSPYDPSAVRPGELTHQAVQESFKLPVWRPSDPELFIGTILSSNRVTLVVQPQNGGKPVDSIVFAEAMQLASRLRTMQNKCPEAARAAEWRQRVEAVKDSLGEGSAPSVRERDAVLGARTSRLADLTYVAVPSFAFMCSQVDMGHWNCHEDSMREFLAARLAAEGVPSRLEECAPQGPNCLSTLLAGAGDSINIFLSNGHTVTGPPFRYTCAFYQGREQGQEFQCERDSVLGDTIRARLASAVHEFSIAWTLAHPPQRGAGGPSQHQANRASLSTPVSRPASRWRFDTIPPSFSTSATRVGLDTIPTLDELLSMIGQVYSRALGRIPEKDVFESDAEFAERNATRMAQFRPYERQWYAAVIDTSFATPQHLTESDASWCRQWRGRTSTPRIRYDADSAAFIISLRVTDEGGGKFATSIAGFNRDPCNAEQSFQIVLHSGRYVAGGNKDLKWKMPWGRDSARAIRERIVPLAVFRLDTRPWGTTPQQLERAGMGHCPPDWMDPKSPLRRGQSGGPAARYDCRLPASDLQIWLIDSESGRVLGFLVVTP